MVTRFPKMYFLVILFLSLSANKFLLAQEITAKAFTDTSNYVIGDHITYTISVEYDSSITIFTPDYKLFLNDVEVLETKAPATVPSAQNKLTTTYTYIISRYDSSDVIIPPVQIKYGIDIDTTGQVPFLTEQDTVLKSVSTNEVNFTVHSFKVDIEEDIRDIKPPISIPLPWWIPVLWVLGAAVLISGLGYLYLRYKKNRKNIPVKKPELKIPAHVKALSLLEQLKRDEVWQKGAIKEYHSRITEIIRNYFEKRFQLPALELTTTEILFHLKNQKGAEEITGLTSAFLNNADLVKFAKYIPLDNINEEMMIQAVEIVERTIPDVTIKEEADV